MRFSKAFVAHKIRRKLNPLILLHGPPGTGKTSLCLGLAQKISIRLSGTYNSTKLIQIKTSILLSKYFSESAKHVDEILSRISNMCEDEPGTFICVLIDEVESIASSREFSTKEGESHDSLRATNALLTGLDQIARYSNVVFLFTSNMCNALEPAFLDRCGLKEYVGPPSIEAKYEILRSVLEKLITCQVVQPKAEMPPYEEAIVQSTAGTPMSKLPGPKLLDITKIIHTCDGGPETQMSGRSLGQLPENALMRYLRGEECDLDTALDFLKTCVLETLKVGKANGIHAQPQEANKVEAEVKKRDYNDSLEDWEPDILEEETKHLDNEHQPPSSSTSESSEKKRGFAQFQEESKTTDVFVKISRHEATQDFPAELGI